LIQGGSSLVVRLTICQQRQTIRGNIFRYTRLRTGAPVNTVGFGKFRARQVIGGLGRGLASLDSLEHDTHLSAPAPPRLRASPSNLPVSCSLSSVSGDRLQNERHYFPQNIDSRFQEPARPQRLTPRVLEDVQFLKKDYARDQAPRIHRVLVVFIPFRPVPLYTPRVTS